MTDAFDDLDALTLEIIGDEITYAADGTDFVPIKAWADHTPDVVDFGISSGVTYEATVQVRKIDAPTINRDLARFYLPRTGKTYRLATSAKDSRCGRLWNVVLVQFKP